MRKGRKGRRNRQGGMNTDTPPRPSGVKAPTANPNSKPGAGYGKPIGGDRGNTANPNSSAGAGYGKPLGGNRGNTANPNASAGAGYGRAVGSDRPSMLGSKPTPSPAFTETPPSPALIKPPITSPPSPATMKSPTTNPNSSLGAGYGRKVGSERPSMLGNKKDVLNSVRKKKQKSR